MQVTGVSKSGNTLTFAKSSTFALSTHNHDTIYKPIGYVPSWGRLTGKPTTFAPSVHTHTKSQITDFPTSLPASDVYAWAKASVKPSYTYSEVGAAASHNHTIAQITGLQGALDLKSNTLRHLNCN